MDMENKKPLNMYQYMKVFFIIINHNKYCYNNSLYNTYSWIYYYKWAELKHCILMTVSRDLTAHNLIFFKLDKSLPQWHSPPACAGCWWAVRSSWCVWRAWWGCCHPGTQWRGGRTGRRLSRAESWGSGQLCASWKLGQSGNTQQKYSVLYINLT